MSSLIKIYRHSHEYGDVVVSCPVYISKGIHISENKEVLKHVCALLNSGGGILVMENLDFNQGTQSKSLDEWYSGMECQFASILSGDDICNYVDFVGNFDDPHLYLFIKSAEHLCTLDYHCRLPTDTATHTVTYSSAVKLCTRQGASKPLSSLPAIPASFVYGKTEETLKQEGKQIQFKNLSSNLKKNLPDKVVYYSSKYISAFANHEGGHIYFGIEDTSAAVLGEEITEEDEIKIERLVQNKINLMIWGNTKFKPSKGVHWDIVFLPVLNCTRGRRKVIVISICKMYGGVFMTCPVSYIIKNGDAKPTSTKLEFDEWKTELLNQSRDIKGLRTRFIKLNLMTPQSRLVFSLPHTLEASRQKVLHLSSAFNIHPRHTLHFLRNEVVRTGLRKVCETFVGEDHLILSLDSWSLEIDLSSKPDSVGACVAVFSAVRGLHVIAIAASAIQTKTEWNFVVNLAVNLKKILVQHGGCNRHLGFKCHVVDVSEPSYLEAFKLSSAQSIYPSTFTVQGEMMNDILNALTIAVASYKPFSDTRDDCETEHYFLLTCDQLELLWTHHLTKELWIHGPPGCGKTIAAMEMMRILRQRGCRQDELLYVAENLLLCAYVKSFNLGTVVNRRELMQESTDVSLFPQKYGAVKNVIVDEAQNFKDRDGDWYLLLEKLSKQNNKGSLEVASGYFWVFMDYAQKVHKFSAGLPSLIGKNNFMLREISRNSQEIYTYARKFMDAPSEGSPDSDGFPGCSSDSAYHLGHDYSSGNQVNVVKCSKSSLETILGQILKQCVVQEGRDLQDVAVLASKKVEARAIKENLKDSNLETENNNSCVANDFDNPLHPQSRAKTPPMAFHDPSCDQPSFSRGQISSSGSSTEKESDTSLLPQDIVDIKENMTNTGTEKPSLSADNNGPLVISTVKEFSGLDRPVIIGVDPHTNQSHADLDKFLLNLVTRAKDQLIILTTSDELMKKLSIKR